MRRSENNKKALVVEFDKVLSLRSSRYDILVFLFFGSDNISLYFLSAVTLVEKLP